MATVEAVAAVARPIAVVVVALLAWDSTAEAAAPMVAQAAVAQVPLGSMVLGPVLVQAVPVSHGLTGQRGQAVVVVVGIVEGRAVPAVEVQVSVLVVVLLGGDRQTPEVVAVEQKVTAERPVFPPGAVPASSSSRYRGARTVAHYAELDTDNRVIRVLVVANDVITTPDGTEDEILGKTFLTDLLGGTWVQTSYNARIRARYAGPGYAYDAERDEFVPPGWSLIDNVWTAPPVEPLP